MLTTSGFANLAEQVTARCRKLASFSEDPGSTKRTFLSAPMRDCHWEVSSWMKALGMTVSVDAVGNLRGFYPGTLPGAPRILVGSHLDTVPNAGAFDGILGVVLAVGLVESLGDRRLPFGIEVIGFSEEEGVRFDVPFIGSRALVGQIDQELLDRKDDDGVSVRKAIQDFGLNPSEISKAAFGDDVLAYIEFHIEQGPVLEHLGRPLGVVEAIVGQNRLEFTFSGQANHAGTTPMNLRHDALAAAAEWILAVENLAQRTPGIVSTVGFLEAKPGATNVIAGEARAMLDIRHASDGARTEAVDELIRQADSIAARRGVTLRWRTLLAQHAVAMDPFLAAQIGHAIQKAGCEPHRMASGAGHDAMIIAEKIPAAMIFLRTPGGISHDPLESVYLDDVAKALECGLHLLTQLAASREFLGRTCRA
ncbi:MAG: allantoate amidohydrolase [Acidobacteria bacterium]|nr:MAG: allantoate amidohydrolase [Acidobacteriota bacterium]PYU40445.1 MAG: allantoate amidohydrolase [Acidobacteriota bacterium]PYU75663.1 MAG: allantoate amidohydrolase [Acidobacteriota bacterium]